MNIFKPYYAASTCCVTGQASTQAPHPVQRSNFILLARFFILILKFPAEPSIASTSA